MLTVRHDEPLWVERFRPQSIEACVLQTRTKQQIEQIIKTGDVPNLLFYGPPGGGKTTAAKAIAQEAQTDWIMINASNERGIDVIRNKIVGFASTTSLSGNDRKVVILDESDALNQLSMQALRGELERFSKSCSFIFTANHPNRLTDALLSRLIGVDFTPTKDEAEQMQAEVFGLVCEILDHESVTYDETVLISLIQKFFPDVRRIIGELQLYARAANQIDEGLLIQLKGAEVERFVEALKTKKFKDVAQWAADNQANDTSSIYEELYHQLRNQIEPECIPDCIITLGEYQRWDSTVPSKELHMAALGAELMTELTFK